MARLVGNDTPDVWPAIRGRPRRHRTDRLMDVDAAAALDAREMVDGRPLRNSDEGWWERGGWEVGCRRRADECARDGDGYDGDGHDGDGHDGDGYHGDGYHGDGYHGDGYDGGEEKRRTCERGEAHGGAWAHVVDGDDDEKEEVEAAGCTDETARCCVGIGPANVGVRKVVSLDEEADGEKGEVDEGAIDRAVGGGAVGHRRAVGRQKKEEPAQQHERHERAMGGGARTRQVSRGSWEGIEGWGGVGPCTGV